MQSNRDRLFAGSILEHGRYGALRSGGTDFREIPVLARRELMRDLVEKPGKTADDRHAATVFLDALCELEAFAVIERVRRSRPCGPRRDA